MLWKKILLVDSTLLLTIIIGDDVEDDDGPCVRVAVSCNSCKLVKFTCTNSNVGKSHGDCSEVEHVMLNTTHIEEVASLLILLLQKLLFEEIVSMLMSAVAGLRGPTACWFLW
jgi:hypothetical protein